MVIFNHWAKGIHHQSHWIHGDRIGIWWINHDPYISIPSGNLTSTAGFFNLLNWGVVGNHYRWFSLVVTTSAPSTARTGRGRSEIMWLFEGKIIRPNTSWIYLSPFDMIIPCNPYRKRSTNYALDALIRNCGTCPSFGHFDGGLMMCLFFIPLDWGRILILKPDLGIWMI